MNTKLFSNLKTFFKKYKIETQKKNNAKKVIFIVGLPRSGTSLLNKLYQLIQKFMDVEN